MKTILIVDDKNYYHKHFGEFFTKHGFKVETASSIEEAKQKIHERKGKEFDIILTDLDFSTGLHLRHRIDGLKLVRWCKRQGIKSKVVLASTAFGNPIGRAINIPTRILAKRAGAELRKKGTEHFTDLVRPK